MSLAAITAVLLYLLLSFRYFAPVLGLIMLPIGFFGALLGLTIPVVHESGIGHSSGATWHLTLALFTYAVFCMAFAQSCLLLYQEHRLKNPGATDFLPNLPALQSMETSLVVLTLCGFLLMTANLVTGMMSSHARHGSLLLFNHHIILSILAWLGFGVLLIGRITLGWRGRTAAKWTIATFMVLILAYFGTRIVEQLILG